LEVGNDGADEYEADEGEDDEGFDEGVDDLAFVFLALTVQLGEFFEGGGEATLEFGGSQQAMGGVVEDAVASE